MRSDAIISPCGRYRYSLTRGDGRLLAFVMLNPSTADATVDDPTIRRCISFAKREGYDGIEVANVYAWRSTDPRELLSASNPFGDNREHLTSLATRHQTVVCAWGSNAIAAHSREAANLLHNLGARLVCLGTTKDGSPRHPLYVRGDAPLIEWSHP